MFEDYTTQLCKWQVEVILMFSKWEERIKDRSDGKKREKI
jgi:hypothetical protein